MQRFLLVCSLLYPSPRRVPRLNLPRLTMYPVSLPRNFSLNKNRLCKLVEKMTPLKGSRTESIGERHLATVDLVDLVDPHFSGILYLPICLLAAPRITTQDTFPAIHRGRWSCGKILSPSHPRVNKTTLPSCFSSPIRRVSFPQSV